MTLQEHIDYWLEGAEHDLDAAESLFAAGKYDWCLFIGYLVLEKALKAVYVRDNQNRVPPKTHALLKLVEKTSLKLDDEQKLYLDEVSDFNLEARYPEYKREFYKRCTKEFSEKHFARIKEYYSWIKSQIE